MEIAPFAVDEEIIIEKEEAVAENKCTRCGRDGHAMEKCYAKTRCDGTKLTSDAVVKAPQRKKSIASKDTKYVSVCRNGRWFRIPNKNYVGPESTTGEVTKKYTPLNKATNTHTKFVNNSWWDYVPSCTIF